MVHLEPVHANELPRVVIVGGGFGGLRAAKALRNLPVQVTIVDRSNYHLFQPLLYQVATAGLSPADIAAPIRGILRRYRNTRVLLGEVHAIDLENRAVKLESISLPYDFLVLATGATHHYFGHNSWGEFAPGLKTIEDATFIRRKTLQAFEEAEIETDRSRQKAWLTFVVIGAGPTGVEMAGAIAELAHRALSRDFRRIDPTSSRVLLLEAGPRILSSFPETLSAKAQRALFRLGIEVRTNSRVTEVTAEGVYVGKEFIPSMCLIWASGVKASPVGKWLGVPVDSSGRVYVRPDLSVPEHSDIFVIGDAAALLQNGAQLPGLAPVAMQQGTFIGEVILSRLRHSAPPVFNYRDKGQLAAIGRTTAIAAFKRIRLYGFFAWLIWLSVHISYLIGFRNRLLVMIEWAWAYFTFQRGARLITTEHGRPSENEDSVGKRQLG